jgi:hypothetical protein
LQFYDCVSGGPGGNVAETAPTEHVETAALGEQLEVLRDLVAAGRPVPAGRLWGLPELGGGECWVDIAGAAVLARVAPRTITGWLSRRGPRRNPFPPASRFLYRLYWPAAQVRAWRAVEDQHQRTGAG